MCLNEPAASGNRGFSSPGQFVEAVGGRSQLVALPLPLCVCGNAMAALPDKIARVRIGERGKNWVKR